MATHAPPRYPFTGPFDDITKESYRHLFEKWGLSVETQREVFFHGRAIDLVVRCPTVEQQQCLQTTVFAYFRRLNALEFEGVQDPLTIRDYNKIMMRVWGLGTVPSDNPKENDSDTAAPKPQAPSDSYLNRLPSQRTLTIVCVTRPNKILKLTAEFHFQPTAEAGIYHNPAGIAQWLIYPTELELKPANYPLLPLAQGPKLADFLTLCFKEGLLDYISLTLRIGLLINPVTIWQQIWKIQRMKAKVQQVEVHEAVIPYLERHFETYPEDFQRLSIIHALFAGQLQQGLQQGRPQDVEQFLLRLLRQKFPPFSRR